MKLFEKSKRCYNPNCNEKIYRKDCNNDWVFSVKRFHDMACADNYASVVKKYKRETLSTKVESLIRWVKSRDKEFKVK